MTTEPPPASSAEGAGPKVGLFLLLTFGWSWGFWVPKALAAEGLVEGVPVLPELGAFGPTVAAFILVTYTNGISGARHLARRAIRLDFPKRWLIPALFLSPAIVFISLGVAIATDASLSFPWADNPIVLPVAFVVIFFLGGPVQEEFGWRGYLLDPVQKRLSALGGGLAVGLAWAVWHIPLFYVPSETIYYQNPFLGFAVSITLLSVLMTWVYNNTNASLLPALLFHASFNWSQGMFPILDSDLASLTLVGLLVFTTVVVVVYWGPTSLTRADGESASRSGL
ncbi:CPBP family intramembrane metalloprotease [Haloferax sp. MBLA0076]|uniref:CPBP family intramembrane metalloprotease n=1 Tax=Haloferax litoreum TaxID=2666140 RepID=A0A6A8GK88_9EURY|nr:MULTISPECIES: type II CAAX endopeptidase family protein [Haloferax]KAB1190610.1 CPBP family intramembrane metalloprotease [Haloferax sp. CBA1148]MRX23603.1 CPBP family intramembrane metalloprotease [Haloferax litoreum]